MAELVILNIPSDLSDRMHRLAAAGDQEAERWFQELWTGYAGPFECFLCGAEIEKRGRLATLAVPDRRAKKGHKQQSMISVIWDTCMGPAGDGPMEPSDSDGQTDARTAVQFQAGRTAMTGAAMSQ